MRRVSEIIGWDTVRMVHGVHYEVDDLLAWLQEKVPGDFIYGPDEENGHFVFALWDEYDPYGDGRWRVEIRHSSTLLGALEQAVREVADG